ncbi:MAG: tyrosine--tRNA ligase [Alphaproteobacteria bacterium]|nr:tyrosine--tRNA ligase [Alphaproteobacteria bacterium]
MTEKFKSKFMNIMQERGFLHQCSNPEALDAALVEADKTGKPLSAYIGYDATAQSLHVGNLLGTMMLYWWQQCGNAPVTLMGGGTTLVGDPSGKDEQRKLLDLAAINQNINSIKGVFAQFLRYGNKPADAVMINNAEWLLHLNYLEFLRDYGRHFSVNRMLSMDSVKLRLDREQTLSFLEFNYMILQGYDFLELYRRMGVTVQMGGSDQWGNIINGVELGRRVDSVELFALTSPLLTTSSGAKMGKSVNGAIWLNADMLSPYDYYQYWRNTEDADVVRFAKLYTLMPMDEIEKLAKLQGAEINEAKKILAFEVTKLCHGEKAALEAQETARKVFEEGASGDNLPSITIEAARLQSGIALIDLLAESGLVESKGEAKRLIQGGGARINNEAVADLQKVVSANDIQADGSIKLSAGKKKHALVKSQ